MAAGEIHENDAGVRFRVTLKDSDGPVDVSAATSIAYVFQRPDGTVLEVAASPDGPGTDGQLTYTTATSDLDQEGTWRLQVRVSIGPATYHSDIGKFRVHPNLPLEL